MFNPVAGLLATLERSQSPAWRFLLGGGSDWSRLVPLRARPRQQHQQATTTAPQRAGAALRPDQQSRRATKPARFTLHENYYVSKITGAAVAPPAPRLRKRNRNRKKRGEKGDALVRGACTRTHCI